MTPLLDSGHDCEEASDVLFDWVRSLIPRADLVARKRAWEAERARLRVYVRMHEHDRLMDRLGGLTQKERSLAEADRMWQRRPGCPGAFPQDWQRVQFRIKDGVFEAKTRVCGVENVFDVRPLGPEGFPEKIERYSEELRDYEYRFGAPSSETPPGERNQFVRFGVIARAASRN